MGKVMIVTGGSRGIGAATARLAARRGYDVCVNYRSNRAAAERVVAEVERAGRRAVAVAGDVASEADVVRLFEESGRALGPPAVLVSNAGVIDVQARLDTYAVERVQRIFAINSVGAILCAREAVRRMSTRHGGAGGVIVNVGSAASRIGSPGQYVDYAASKAAVDALTIGLAKEVAEEGIRVNAVRPGIIDTEIHLTGGDPDRVEHARHGIPMKRGGTAEEIAAAILWLASDEASYTTGAILDVTGGR